MQQAISLSNFLSHFSVDVSVTGFSMKENVVYGPVTAASLQLPQDYLSPQPEGKVECEYDTIK